MVIIYFFFFFFKMLIIEMITGPFTYFDKSHYVAGNVLVLVLSAGFWVLLQMKPVSMWQELWVKTRYSWESWIWVNVN